MKFDGFLERTIIEILPGQLRERKPFRRNILRGIILLLCWNSLGPLSYFIPLELNWPVFWQFILPIIYIILSFILLWIVLSSSIVKAQIEAAIHVLEDPPAIGETFVQYLDGDNVLYTSEPILFDPPIKPIKEDNGHKINRRSQAQYLYPDIKDRFNVVEHFLDNKKNNRVSSKKAWGRTKYDIRSTTTLNDYIKEYHNTTDQEFFEIMGRKKQFPREF